MKYWHLCIFILLFIFLDYVYTDNYCITVHLNIEEHHCYLDVLKISIFTKPEYSSLSRSLVVTEMRVFYGKHLI